MRSSNWKRAIAGAIATIFTVGALSACAAEEEQPPEASDTLRVVLAAQPATLDPVVGSRTAGVVWGTMLEPLVNLDQDLKPIPTGLITAWERTDPTTWELTVRDGVTFSNGEPADASAVAATILQVRDDNSSILKTYWGNVTDVEAVDSTTVRITTDAPQFDLVDRMATVYLVPPAYYAESGTEKFGQKPIGTGPYTFDSAVSGQSMTVTRNDDYWGEPAATEKITFTWANEPAQRLALLRSGSVDVALDLPPTQADEAESADGIAVARTDSTQKAVVFFETARGPLVDTDIRRAAALAIDRDQIVAGVLAGNGTADSGLLNVNPGTQPAQSLDSDLEEAKRLLDGRDVTIPITYAAGQWASMDDVVQAVGGMLEEAGFGVTYEPVDYGTYVKRAIGKELEGIHFQLVTPSVALSEHYVGGFMTSTSITGNCIDPRIDALAAEALQADDAEAAAPIYEELNALGVVELNCFVPLYKPEYVYATRDSVSGILRNALNVYDFTGTVLG